MIRKKIYNPDSEEKTSERKIFGGDPTGIFELNDIKYQWVDNFSQFNDQKTNFFEGNVTNYSKGSLDLDDF